MGIISTWLVGVPNYVFGCYYPIPLRGYIPMDVTIIPTPLASGAHGTMSTQGRHVRPILSHNQSATPGVSSQHLLRSLELRREGQVNSPLV